MESIYSELALCGSKNECARTDTVFVHLSEVSKGTVSLMLTGKMMGLIMKMVTTIHLTSTTVAVIQTLGTPFPPSATFPCTLHTLNCIVTLSLDIANFTLRHFPVHSPFYIGTPFCTLSILHCDTFLYIAHFKLRHIPVHLIL